MNNLITLNNLDKAKNLIQQANVSQLKEIIARADALKIYIAQAKKGLEIQNQVAEIKLRAERKIGEISKAISKKPGDRADLTSTHLGERLQNGKLLSLKELGISHHERYETIANLPEEFFEQEIQTVKKLNKELTTAGIIRFASLYFQQDKKKNFKSQELPKGKFDILLADPPWQYDFSPSIVLNIEQHYPTMSKEEICNLKIPSADNAVLFLWATNPKLEEALKVMKAWGFQYKTNACWDKQKPTSSKMGYWFFGQHELLLIGTKGKFSPPAPENRVSSLYSEKKTKHSKKPDYFYQLIERMFPNGKYLELFARQKREGWISWGQEIN